MGADVTVLAHAFHELGINVLPIGRDKRPRVGWDHWQTQRQTATDLAALPFREVATVGVGAVVGAVSGDLLCIDADKAGRHVLDSILGKLGLPRDYRWAVETPGGGYHVWVRSPNLTDKGLSSGAPFADFPGADHLELRWKDCQTVLPGSAHPSGGVYKWVNGNGTPVPAELPTVVSADKLMLLAKWRGTAEDGKPTPAASLPEVIHEGQGRDNAMTSFAGAMRRRGASPEAILAALRVDNERICRPPLPEHDLERIAKSIGKKEPGTPAITTRELPEGYDLTSLDWPTLIRDGVPPVEYISEPYFPKGARIWIWGATGSHKSLYCAWVGSKLSRQGVRVSYFSEENPIQEELRRLSKLQPDPRFFRMFHRTGMDLLNPQWVSVFLSTTKGDNIVFLDSWTDLWSGDEGDNRAAQQFDATVLKPLQAQGATPVVLHHTGHKYMFSDRAGATAGRGASSLGQKADVTLEFKAAGEDMFTIVYGKSRIGGIRQPNRTFQSQDTDDDGVAIVEVTAEDGRVIEGLMEKMVQAILTAPAGYLTTTALRVAVGGKRDRQTHALALLESDPRDPRIQVGVEKVQTQDGKFRDAKVWRPSRGNPLGDRLSLPGVGE